MEKNNNGFYFQGELHIIFLFCTIVQIDLFIILVFPQGSWSDA